VYKQIKDIDESFFVFAWGQDKIQIASASKPFVKGVEDLYEVTFSNGRKIRCTLGHRILAKDGYVEVGNLSPGDSVLCVAELDPSFVEQRPSFSDNLRETSLEPALSVHGEDGQRFSKTVQDSQFDYQTDFRSHDERLQSELGNVQVSSPSQVGVQKRKGLAYEHKDDQEYRAYDSLGRSHELHPSSRDALRLSEAPSAGTLSRFFCKLYKLASGLPQAVHQSKPGSFHLEPTPESSQPANQFSEPYEPPCVAVTSIAYLRTDTYYDLTVPLYHNYIAEGIIHHNSSKTTLGTIEALIKATGGLPWCFDPTRTNYFKYEYPKERLKRNGPQHVRVIAEDYQNGILRNLIPTYRKWTPKEYLKNGRWADSYSAGEQTLTLYHPKTGEVTGSVEFMSNKQDIGSFQGPPRHMLIFDEEPKNDVYQENIMRMTTAGRMDVLFCMTPTKGLSWTYDLYTKGEDKSGNRVDWFQIASVCNPYANLDVLREIMSEIDDYDTKRMRLLGEFISLSGLVYGKAFQHSVHVIPPFESSCNCNLETHLESCPSSKYVAFLGIDPHMSKPSACLLGLLDREDNFIVDRCYLKSATTSQMKRDLLLSKDFLKGKRLKFSVFDVSSKMQQTVLGSEDVFTLLTRSTKDSPGRIPKARVSKKFAGSIVAGVDTIKRRLHINPLTNKPKLFIMNRPENQLLIKSFKTLQRDSFSNEDVVGQRDKIQEGVHDHHACLRYIMQNTLRWNSQELTTVSSILSDPEAVNF
jgi:phage terminase large subunit-like protein